MRDEKERREYVKKEKIINLTWKVEKKREYEKKKSDIMLYFFFRKGFK